MGGGSWCSWLHKLVAKTARWCQWKCRLCHEVFTECCQFINYWLGGLSMWLRYMAWILHLCSLHELNTICDLIWHILFLYFFTSLSVSSSKEDTYIHCNYEMSSFFKYRLCSLHLCIISLPWWLVESWRHLLHCVPVSHAMVLSSRGWKKHYFIDII